MQHVPASPILSDEEYRELRRRLIRYFTTRGCHSPADLADDTVLRLLLKFAEQPVNCPVDQYAFAIARNVLREAYRASRRTVSLDPAAPPAGSHYCLDQTRLEAEMLPLSPSHRAFLHAYFSDRKDVLARSCGVSTIALRGRAHRAVRGIRARLGLRNAPEQGQIPSRRR